MDITSEVRMKVLTMKKFTLKTQIEIARECKISQSAVSKLLKLERTTGGLRVRRIGNCGRKRLTTNRDDRLLIKMSKLNPKKTSDELQRDIAAHDIKLSTRSVRRRLCKAGRKARRPLQKSLLTTVMKKRRLVWAKEHRQWSIEDWCQVCGSDLCLIIPIVTGL